MKITKRNLLGITVTTLALLLAWLLLKPTQIVNTATVNTEASNSIAKQTERSGLQYQVTIESSVQDAKQTLLTHSSLSWNMALIPTDLPEKFIGQLSEVNFTENGKSSILVSELLFKVNYNGKQFQQLNLLGLPETHTLQVVSQILKLMSFDENTPLSFEDDLRKQVFLYTRHGRDITRTATSTQYLTTEQQPQQEQEDWHLTLAQNNQISRLSYTNARIWQQQSQQYRVTQSIMVTTANSTIKIANLNPSNNQNAHLINNTELQNAYSDITDEQTLILAIEALKSSLDPDLAKIIGEYLTTHYTAFEISQLLLDMPKSNSAIIYALQKYQTPEAEQVLVDLLVTANVNDMNKHRIAIALGRFGASSNIGFNALTQLSKSDKHAAATALLSLGSMAYFTPEKSQSVAELLSQNLAQGETLATTVLAVENSKKAELIEELPPLLNHPDDAVKLNAIKVLTKHGKHQDLVINAVVNNPKSKFVDAFARTFTESQQHLTKRNINRLQRVINESENPIVVKKLTNLLNVAS